MRGGRLVIAKANELVSLDPLLASDGPSERIVTSQIYETLVAADPVTGEIKPSLARWTVSSDGRTYVFEIAPDAVWSDGRPIIAEDVVTSVKALARSKTASTGGRGGVGRIEGYGDYRAGRATTIKGLVAEERRLTMRLDGVFCPIFSFLLLTPPLPTHVFGRYLSDGDPSKNTDGVAEHAAPPVASGPFVFGAWRHGEEIVLRANERYWRGRPYLDELAFRLTDVTKATEAFRTGALDLAWTESFRWGDALRDLASDSSFRVVRTPSPGYSFIGWNTRSQTAPALQDKRIRQALAYGLDADLAMQRLLLGEGVRTHQHMDPTSWAYTPGLNEYPYDPAKAESLIRSAGYSKGADGIYQKDGRALSFTLVTNAGNDLRTKVIQFATDQYGAIGVHVTPKLVDFKEFSDRVLAGDPSVEAFVLGWAWSTDPFGSAVWQLPTTPGASHGGLVNYDDPEVGAAIDAGRFGPDCGISARRRAYDTLNRRLNEDQPYNFLFTPNVIFLMSARVRGVVPGPYVPMPDSHLWWLAPQK